MWGIPETCQDVGRGCCLLLEAGLEVLWPCVDGKPVPGDTLERRATQDAPMMQVNFGPQ